MKTIRGIFLLFSILIASNGVLQAQQKTVEEEVRELGELVRQQKEIMNKSTDTDIQTDASPKESRLDTIVQPEEPHRDTIMEPEKPIIEKFRMDNKWSLEKCIRYAIEHNIYIKQLQLQQQDAEIQYNTAANSRLPNLNAAISQEWYFGRQMGQQGVYEDWNQSRSTLGVQSNIPVFTGFRIPNLIAYGKLEIKAAVQNLEKAKEDLSLNITSLFLQVLFAKELYNINEKQLELSKTQVERTKLLIQAGSIPKSQLFDIEAQVAKDEVAVVNAQNDLDLALLDLAQSLELERNTNFDIYIPDFSDDIIARYRKSLQHPDVIYEKALNIKPVILGQEYRVASSNKALNVAKAGYYPQLYFSLGFWTFYNYVFKPKEQINPGTNEPIILNPPFSEQIRDYGYKLVSLHLNIPIFNRFEVRNQVRSAKINIFSQQLILESNKKTLYKEIQTAYKNAMGAQEKYRASSRAVKAASESFEYVRKHYELGKATVFEFNEARTRFIQSLSEQVQAKYEFILRTKILDFYNGIPISL
jgi:outer membrane protein